MRDQVLLSLVFRLSHKKLLALRALSKSTRVRQSEYLREAISDLLVKYGEPAPAAAHVVPGRP